MKTVFYKKLVPLALIASMAVSNVSMVADAAVFDTGKAVAGSEVAVDDVDLGEVTVDDSVEYNAGATATFAVAGVTSNAAASDYNSGTKTITPAKMYSDTAEMKYKLTWSFDKTDETNYASISALAGIPGNLKVASTEDGNGDFAGKNVTVGTPAFDAESGAASVEITVKSDTVNFDLYFIINSSAIFAGNVKFVNKISEKPASGNNGGEDTDPTEEDAAKNAPVAIKNKATAVKFDYLDPENATKDVTVEYEYTKGENTAFAPKLTDLKFTAEGDIKGKSLRVAASGKTGGKITVVYTVKNNYAQKISAKIGELTLDDFANCDWAALGKSNGGSDISDTGALTGYGGKATDLDLTALTKAESPASPVITSVGAGAFKDNSTIRSIKLGKANLAAEGAIENCAKLTYIDMTGCTSYVSGAIKNCPKAIVVYSGKGLANDDLNKLKEDCKNIIDIDTAEGAEAPNSVSVPGGSSVLCIANGTTNVLYYNGTANKMTMIMDNTSALKDVNLNNIKWTAKDADGKISNATGDVGSVVNVNALKSKGAFNNNVTLYAQVPTEFDAKGAPVRTSYKDLASIELCVNPQKVSELKLATAKSGVFEIDSADSPTSGNGVKYKLTLSENASFKIPVVAADGTNKALNYEVKFNKNDGDTPGAFTVIGGKVTALKANAKTDGAKVGSIEVTPYDTDDAANVKATVDVYVKAANKDIKASATALSMAPQLTQEFTLYQTADNSAVEVTAAYATGVYDLKITDANGNVTVSNNGKFKLNGAAKVTVEYLPNVNITDAKTFSDMKADALTFSYKAGGKDKNLVVKMNFATAPVDAKAIKQAGKKPANGKDVYVGIPVGGHYSLGLSVNPPAAKNEIKMSTLEDNEKENFAIAGDTVFALKSGKTVDVEATVGGIQSYNYHFTSYTPASTIAVKGLRGGFLVQDPGGKCNKDWEAATGGATEIKTEYDTFGSDEPIVWTANKPGSVFVEERCTKPSGSGSEGSDSEKKELIIRAAETGTFTITGTTLYTKQKVAFKVNVAKGGTYGGVNDAPMWKRAELAEWNDATPAADGDNSNVEGSEGNPIEAAIGEKFQVALKTSKCGSAPTYEKDSTSTGDATVDAKGNVVIKSAGNIIVNVGTKKVYFKATAAAGATKFSMPTSVKLEYDKTTKLLNAKSAAFKVSSASKTAVCYYVPEDDYKAYKENSTADKSAKKLDGDSKGYTLPTIEGGNENTLGKMYRVFAYVGSKKENDNVTIADLENDNAGNDTIYVPKVSLKSATIVDPVLTEEAPYGSLKDMGSNKEGMGIPSGANVTLNVAVTGQDGTGKTVIADAGNIKWESSNNNIATVTGNEESINIQASDHYFGKVTITGTVANGGKKVKVSLYVNPPEVTEKPTQSDDSGDTDSDSDTDGDGDAN